MISLKNRLIVRERPPGSPVMHQTWSHLTFLHWEVEPSAVQMRLPDGLRVDTFEGKTYIALVPFTMSGIHLNGLPKIPGTSAFHETNVRVYVTGPDGTPGVWFCSLEAANPLAVLVARTWFGLPYHWAKMRLSNDHGLLSYSSKRMFSFESTQVEAKVSQTLQPAEPGSLEFWLVERYVLFAQHNKKLLVGKVHHLPYQIAPVLAPEVQDELLASAGFPVTRPPDLAHYSPGVTVEVFGPKHCKS